ncbi:MAG TPA: patatin-like phospholipase family protein [Nitrospiria bacterium]|jgi:NTE family protein|nr:patatin-like phospholipase family protein [Nitrospiria bacterium]
MPKVALVLGGGAARGFAHVGVIRVLEQEKIPIHIIVGTSVGSLIGALYADKGNSFDLEMIAFKLEKEDLLDFSVFASTTGPVKGDRLEQFVKDRVSRDKIEDLPIPFAAVATNLNTGEPVVLKRGSIARAVRASSSIPGVFTPVQYLDMTLVDGGVVDNVPVDVARTMGADLVIAVNIGKDVVNNNLTNIIDITLQAVNIMANENSVFKMRDADVLIEPDVGSVKTMDFSMKESLMRAGIAAAENAIPEIREKIREWQTRHEPAPNGGG